MLSFMGGFIIYNFWIEKLNICEKILIIFVKGKIFFGKEVRFFWEELLFFFGDEELEWGDFCRKIYFFFKKNY